MSQHSPVATSGGSSENSSGNTQSSQHNEENTSSDVLGCSEEISDKEEDDEEEEGKCSARFCRQPVAEQISWVQCDHCQEWFHCVCVDLTKEYAEKIDSYNCKGCRGVSLNQRGVVVRCGKTRVTHQLRSKGIPPPVPSSSNSGTVNTSSSSSSSSNISGVPKAQLQNSQLAAHLMGNTAIK